MWRDSAHIHRTDVIPIQEIGSHVPASVQRGGAKVYDVSVHTRNVTLRMLIGSRGVALAWHEVD